MSVAFGRGNEFGMTCGCFSRQDKIDLTDSGYPSLTDLPNCVQILVQFDLSSQDVTLCAHRVPQGCRHPAGLWPPGCRGSVKAGGW